jgi:uncharacterized protein (TIGR00106 family)
VRAMKPAKECTVIAEFSLHPIGEGTSLSRFVRAAVAELAKAKGLRLMVTPMSTIVEARDLSDILDAIEAAHERLFSMGAKRVSFDLRVDDRRDKPRRMEDKIASVEPKPSVRSASARGRAGAVSASQPSGRRRSLRRA